MLFFNEQGKPQKGKSKDAGQRFAKLLDKHNKNETRLRRAFTAWEKTHAALKRAEKKFDKAFAECSTEERKETP